MSTDDDDLNDDDLLRQIDDAMNVPVPDPSPERIAAVRAAAVRQQGNPQPTTARVITSRRAMLLATAAAAVGAVGGAVVANSTQHEPLTAAGPPTEALAFSPSGPIISGSSVSGKVINHTWGVELLLDASGFPVPEAFRIVYIDTGGAIVEAGGFVGAELPIHCRCNAALLRTDIVAIEIRDASDATVSTATFT